MMKKFNEFINEDLLSKNIRMPDVKCDDLKELYPEIQLKYNENLKIVISSNDKLYLTDAFYKALENDNIKVDDIIFENCEEIRLHTVTKFTKISDYGTFMDGIEIFNCGGCRKLTSLEGAPDTIIHNFVCNGCYDLTSLNGAPETIGGNFYCSHCPNLTSLEGSPKEVSGYFYCTNCDNLQNLEGSPKTVGLDFNCSNCENLTSLKFTPEKVGGDFICYDNNLDFIEQAKQKYGSRVKS